ncbi:MAG: response regulator, partial [Gemmatimonadota bacterium]
MPSPDLLASKILIVDDEPANLDLLTSCLQEEGYQRLIATADSRAVIPLYEAELPDLILLDLHMPGLNGFEIMAQLGERVPSEEYLPILVLTADITEATKQRALSGGAKDFLTKPIDLTESLLRIGNLLHTRWLHQHQRQARIAAEQAEKRALFLAGASHVLASSLDHTTTLSLLCQSIVPEIADYCVVDILNEDGGVSRIALKHADP